MTANRPAARRERGPLRPPGLSRLGRDLMTVSRAERLVALLRPGLALAVYAGLWQAGLVWLAPLAGAAVVLCAIAASHELVHGTLGVSPRARDAGLMAYGWLLLGCGHAFQATHLHHHRRFPHHDDIEGAAARGSLVGALLQGPTYQPRLWTWAFGRAKRRQRCWLLAEAAGVAALVLAAALGWLPPAFRAYVALALLVSWLFPVVTARWQHPPAHETRGGPALTVRGRVAPFLSLGLLYHLEHHWYPRVPGPRLGELARRLDPWIEANGLRPRRVP